MELRHPIGTSWQPNSSHLFLREIRVSHYLLRRSCRQPRKLLPLAPIEQIAVTVGFHPAPLLEEKRHARRLAVIADLPHPIDPIRPQLPFPVNQLDQPTVGEPRILEVITRFTADNYPGNSRAVELDRSEQGLNRNETNRDINFPQDVDPPDVVLVFDGNTGPEVRRQLPAAGIPDAVSRPT